MDLGEENKLSKYLFRYCFSSGDMLALHSSRAKVICGNSVESKKVVSRLRGGELLAVALPQHTIPFFLTLHFPIFFARLVREVCSPRRSPESTDVAIAKSPEPLWRRANCFSVGMEWWIGQAQSNYDSPELPHIRSVGGVR